ncbi:MAG: O-antigen/teichoic acid export membrane protein [Kiritimatiellia bacterium]
MSTDSSTFVRGSSLLLFGRVISLSINFVAQVIIVRYLTKQAFGSYAFALTIATLASNVATLGFHTTLARFAPGFVEQKDYRRLWGSFLFMSGCILAISVAIIACVLGARGVISARYVTDPATLGVLFILIYYIPVNALDRYFENALAVFAGPRAIFIRRHLVGPALKLSAVLAVILVSGDEQLLAWCYLGAGALGVLLYVSILGHVFRKQGILGELRNGLTIPAGALFRFGFPVLLSDLNLVIRSALVLFLLESLHGSESVADFRAVIPLADLNKFVSRNFTILFIPVAARLLAQNRTTDLVALLRQAVTWIAILTFPLFLISFVMPGPVCSLVFGKVYTSSGPVLAALALAYYVHAMMSFCAHTLKVYNKVQLLAVLEILATILVALLAFWWIPIAGAVGAASAVAAGTLLQALATLILLWRLTGVMPFGKETLGLWASLVLGTLILFAIVRFSAPSIWIGLPIAAVIALTVAAINRHRLSLDNTFPELARIPFIKKWLS